MKSISFLVITATACFLGCFTTKSEPLVQKQPQPQPPTFQVSSAAFSSDGKLLLTGYSVGWAVKGDKYKRLVLWETGTGKQLWSTEGTDDLFPVAFLPDGKAAVVRSGFDGFQTWDVGKGTMVGSFGKDQTEYIYCAALSADGKKLLAGHQPRSDPGVVDYHGRLKLWDVASGQLLQTIGELPPIIASVALSPDGKFALSGRLSPEQVILFDLATGKRHMTFDGRWPVMFCPDGKLAVCFKPQTVEKTTTNPQGRKNIIVFWDVTTGKDIRSLDEWTQDYAICPDGKHVLLARSEPDKTTTFARIDSTTGKKTWSSSLPGSARAVAFSHDGKLAFGSFDSYGGRGGGSIQLVLLDANNGKTLRLLEDRPIAEPYPRR